jgi:hypothetical protein
MTVTADSQIAELASLVRDQMREIDRLRTVAVQAERARAENVRLKDEIDALIGWIGGDGDALACLQQIYANPRTPESNKIKAALGALPFERGKPAQVVIEVDFRERVRNARLKTMAETKARWAAEDAAKLIEGTVLGCDGEPPAA